MSSKILDSFDIARVAQSEKGKTLWLFEGAERYSILFQYEDDDVFTSWLRQVCRLFVHCDLDSVGERTQGAFPLLRLEQVYPENPGMNEPVQLGLFVRQNAPIWVVMMVFDMVNALHEVNNYEGKTFPSIMIDTVELFDSWLGDHPIIGDFCNDIVLVSLNREVVKDQLEKFEQQPYGWRISANEIPIFFSIRSITKTSVGLMPYGTTIRLFGIQIAHEMKEFKQACILHQVCLFSSSRPHWQNATNLEPNGEMQ